MSATLLAHYLTQMRRSIVGMETAETAYREVVDRHAGTMGCPALDRVAADGDPDMVRVDRALTYYCRRAQVYALAAQVELAARTLRVVPTPGQVAP